MDINFESESILDTNTEKNSDIITKIDTEKEDLSNKEKDNLKSLVLLKTLLKWRLLNFSKFKDELNANISKLKTESNDIKFMFIEKLNNIEKSINDEKKNNEKTMINYEKNEQDISKLLDSINSKIQKNKSETLMDIQILNDEKQEIINTLNKLENKYNDLVEFNKQTHEENLCLRTYYQNIELNYEEIKNQHNELTNDYNSISLQLYNQQNSLKNKLKGFLNNFNFYNTIISYKNKVNINIKFFIIMGGTTLLCFKILKRKY